MLKCSALKTDSWAQNTTHYWCQYSLHASFYTCDVTSKNHTGICERAMCFVYFYVYLPADRRSVSVSNFYTKFSVKYFERWNITCQFACIALYINAFKRFHTCITHTHTHTSHIKYIQIYLVLDCSTAHTSSIVHPLTNTSHKYCFNFSFLSNFELRQDSFVSLLACQHMSRTWTTPKMHELQVKDEINEKIKFSFQIENFIDERECNVIFGQKKKIKNKIIWYRRWRRSMTN